MSHKDEAREWIDEAPATLHDAGLNADTAERAAMCVGLAQAHATLALVDALEAANEQARIANLIALAGSEINDVIGDPSFDPATEALLTLVNSFPIAMDDEVYGFAPEVAAALGLEVGGDA